MKKTFVIQVEYPDCDIVPSEEIMEVAQECIEHYMERYFGENIMDGDYDRIKVKEVTDGFSLVKRMREAQKLCDTMASKIENETQRAEQLWEIMNDSINLESEVDEYLEEMEQ